MRELDQEMASVANFINQTLGNDVSPYYWEIAASFLVPAVYYPSPQIDTAGDALNSYEAAYMWLIKFFHKTDGEAHDMARCALMAIKDRRNVIPLINEDGSQAGRGFRVLDPTIKQVERGAWQMELKWHSPRNFERGDASRAQKYKFIVNGLGDIIPSKEYMDHNATAATSISRQAFEPIPAGLRKHS